MVGGLSTSPIHFSDFEKTQLFHLRVDLPHSWVFPEHSCRRHRNSSIFGNHDFLRETLKWHCPTPPTFLLTAICCLSLVSCNRRAELDNSHGVIIKTSFGEVLHYKPSCITSRLHNLILSCSKLRRISESASNLTSSSM